jgi:hypothetical protein
MILYAFGKLNKVEQGISVWLHRHLMRKRIFGIKIFGALQYAMYNWYC